ncbi:MAG TPA: type II secretion system protein [Candidatus Woesebacteria bacterium]|nr:type II secretion system protein [Candidatus Woesebacteria bacterium]
MKIKTINHGQTLIEIVVAVGIISLVLVGVSDIVSRSLSMLSYQKDRSGAVNLAQKQINYYRGERDKAPITFFNNLDSFQVCQGTIDEDGKFDGKYNCVISYHDLGDVVDMTVTVIWNGGKKDADGQEVTMKVELSQDLAKPTR